MTSKQQNLRTLFVFALAGVGFSIYAYLLSTGFSNSEFCVIGESFNCDVVAQSVYSKLLGIPVSILGVIGYGFMALAAIMKLRKPEDRTLTNFLLIAATGGFLFSLYLSSMEAFVIRSWCIVCIMSQVTMLSIFLMTVYLWNKERKS